MSRSGGPIGSHIHTCSSTAESTAAKPKLSARMRKRSTKMMVFFTVLVLLLVFGSLVPVFAPLPSLSSHKSPHHHYYKNMNVGKFEIDEDMFSKDGHPFQIIGGDLHYFRVLPEYWEDRLLRAKAMGLNTIQTYVPWNLHEPKPGKLVFEGIADLVSFLKLCQKLDLLVMLRALPEYWEDRLLRAKAMDLNTIQTYVPWNLHELKPGKLVFEGIADLVSFLKRCQKLD